MNTDFNRSIKCIRAILCALGIAMTASIALCQQPTVHYSISQFYGDSTHTLIELYYGVLSSQLVYTPIKGGTGDESAAVEFTLTGNLTSATGGKSIKELWRFIAQHTS